MKFDRLPLFATPSRRSGAGSTPISRSPGITREKVLATIVELLQTTLIRVGNDEYARDNGAYGLTTFRNKHATCPGRTSRSCSRARAGSSTRCTPRTAASRGCSAQCQEIPGQRLFQYLDDDGRPVAVHSHDVNDYLRDAADGDFTAKDFRTWVATVIAAGALGRLEPPESERAEQAAVREVVADVAEELGNTPAVAACVVHPPEGAHQLPHRRPGGGVERDATAPGTADAGRTPNARAARRPLETACRDGVTPG